MSLMYRNIIVAVDGSNEAEWALKKAIEITKRNNATLHIVHVSEIRVYPSDASTIRARAEKFGNELLEKYEGIAKEQGLESVETILEFGEAKTMITRNISKKMEADLIVCGKTGLNAVEHFFLGSVSEHITRTANCDVLIVKTPK